MGQLSCQLDGLEPRSDGNGAWGSGIAHHCAVLSSGAIVMFDCTLLELISSAISDRTRSVNRPLGKILILDFNHR